MYFIRDKSHRNFVGDNLVWSNLFTDATFYFFPEHALEHIQKVLPQMPRTDYTLYKIRYESNNLEGGCEMNFIPVT